MNRIEERFGMLRRAGRKGMIVYIGAGDPDLRRTRELVLGMDEVGVDVLELGVPFSDPLADGMVNQMAAQRGLASGTTPGKVLETVKAIRGECGVPIVLYVYYNVVHRRGVERFIGEAASAGVDGMLVLDLPPEEGGSYEDLMGRAGLSNVYLVAPTTPEERIAGIVSRARGFIYYVSREGVTGMQTAVAADLEMKVGRIRAHSQLPVAVGFGISNAEQARAVSRYADAVVVGSAVVEQVGRYGGAPDLVKRISGQVKLLVEAVKGA
jgi:tryptophan synthase alpha chain